MSRDLKEKPSKLAKVNSMQPDEEPVDDVDEDLETIPYRYTITSYGADYPVDGLVKRINSQDIVVPSFDPEIEVSESMEGFQRQFMWTKPQCDRFIESLLLGLPVPGIFLVKQTDGRFLVLDGQQRLRTLQAFYKGILRDRKFSLENVQEIYKGQAYDDLDVEDRRRLDNGIVHATIVKQDQPSDDQSSIYLIFERLNTGGTTLHPQEIRVALFRGTFVKLIRDLNGHKAWRQLYGKKSHRLKDQELILRFFALHQRWNEYQRPMKDFLNQFMSAKRVLDDEAKGKMEALFKETCDLILDAVGEKAFRLKTAVNAAVLDSVMVGVATRLRKGKPIAAKASLRGAYDELVKVKSYLDSVEKSTADEESVKNRIRLAIEAFSKVR